MPKTRVMVVDDSILFRETLAKCLNEDPSIEVVATAGDVYEERDKLIEFRPDVMTLDIEMPKMNGIEFLKKLIPQYPIPVVVVTSSPVNSFEAISAGAVDFVKKPVAKGLADIKIFAKKLCNQVKVAAVAKVKAAPVVQPHEYKKSLIDTSKTKNRIIALGASTGGTDALQVVVQDLPGIYTHSPYTLEEVVTRN